MNSTLTPSSVPEVFVGRDALLHGAQLGVVLAPVPGVLLQGVADLRLQRREVHRVGVNASHPTVLQTHS